MTQSSINAQWYTTTTIHSLAVASSGSAEVIVHKTSFESTLLQEGKQTRVRQGGTDGHCFTVQLAKPLTAAPRLAASPPAITPRSMIQTLLPLEPERTLQSILDLQREYESRYSQRLACSIEKQLSFTDVVSIKSTATSPSSRQVTVRNHLTAFNSDTLQWTRVTSPEAEADLAETIFRNLQPSSLTVQQPQGLFAFPRTVQKSLADVFRKALSGDNICQFELLASQAIGTRVLPPHVTIYRSQLAGRTTDDEGLANCKLPLIDKGMVIRYLAPLKLSYQLGIPIAGGGTFTPSGDVSFEDVPLVMDIQPFTRPIKEPVKLAHSLRILSTDFLSLTCLVSIIFRSGAHDYQWTGRLSLPHLLANAGIDGGHIIAHMNDCIDTTTS